MLKSFHFQKNMSFQNEDLLITYKATVSDSVPLVFKVLILKYFFQYPSISISSTFHMTSRWVTTEVTNLDKNETYQNYFSDNLILLERELRHG